MREIVRTACIALLCVSCAPPSGPDAEEENEIHESQGRHLVGGNLGGLVVSVNEAVGADGRPFDAIQVRQAQIVGTRGAMEHAGAAAALVGTTLRGTDMSGGQATAVQMQIVRICPHARPPIGWVPPAGWSVKEGCIIPPGWTDMSGSGEYEYEVRFRTGAGDPFKPLCDATWNRAVPASGTWDAKGAHTDSAAGFTFACPDGAVVKCMNWGYKPWEHRDVHQACTRMARADYCGNGVSHTVEGTLIGMADRYRINQSVVGALREASWSPDGPVRCLSRKRWTSLPPGGPPGCQVEGKIKDPRIDPMGRYCEDLSLDGDLLVNSSLVLDEGLYLWNSSMSGDSFTTSRFFFDSPERIKAPGPEYGQTADFAGSVYRADLIERKRQGTVPLVSYLGPAGDHLTTTQAPPAGYTKLALEGHVFPPGSPARGLAGLYSWRNEKTGDHLTSGEKNSWGPQTCEKLDANGGCLPGSRHKPENGYVYLRLEGYLPTLDLR